MAVLFSTPGNECLVLICLGLVFLIGTTTFAYLIIRRRLDPTAAILMALLVILNCQPSNTLLGFPVRQIVLMMLFGGLWLFDVAATSRRWLWLSFLGGLVCGLTLSVDLFIAQMMPVAAAFAALASLDHRTRKHRLGQLAMSIAGFAVAIAIFLPFHYGYTGVTPVARMGTKRIYANTALLQHDVLPYALGYNFTAIESDPPGHWSMPTPWRYVHSIVLLSYLGMFLASAVRLLFSRMPWSQRRIGIAGFCAVFFGISLFLLSYSPSDVFSSRYIWPWLILAPFAVVPVLAAIPTRLRPALIVPWLIIFTVAGWMNYSPYREGLRPVHYDPVGEENERAVIAFLRERHIGHAAATYWNSYHLTLMGNEDPIVVPIDPGQDRYQPYRQQVHAAAQKALIFGPKESLAQLYQEYFDQQSIPYERHQIGRFTVLIVGRVPDFPAGAGG